QAAPMPRVPPKTRAVLLLMGSPSPCERADSGLEGLAVDGFLVGNGGQLPGARRRRTHVGVHVHVDDAGPLVLQGLLHRGREVLRARDGVAVGSAGARPGREVGVVALAGFALVEGRADLAAVEQAVLQVADRTPGE